LDTYLMFQMDAKRPLVYWSLQLGRSWDDFVCKLLGDVEVDTTTTTSTPSTPLPMFGLPAIAVA